MFNNTYYALFHPQPQQQNHNQASKPVFPASPSASPTSATSNPMVEEWVSASPKLARLLKAPGLPKASSSPATQGFCMAEHCAECPVRLTAANCWRTKIPSDLTSGWLWYSPAQQPPTCWCERNRILLVCGSIQGNLRQGKEQKSDPSEPALVYTHLLVLTLDLNWALCTIVYSTLHPKTFHYVQK